MKVETLIGSPHPPDLHEWVLDHGRLVARVVVILAAIVSLSGCALFNKIPPQLTDCRTLGCPLGGVCSGPASGAGAFTCEAEVVAPGPICPLEGQSANPTTWCGCWENGGRTNGEWKYTGDCKPAEPEPEPPAAEGCTLTGVPKIAVPEPYRPKYQDAVLAAIRRAHPSCLWGDCLIDDETQQGFQAKVEAEIRKGGKDPATGQTYAPLCAGQHEKTTDEIAVAGSPTEPREGYNVFSGDDSEAVPRPPGSNRRTIMWAKSMGAWYPPGTPEPNPTPSTPPAEPQTACPEPRPGEPLGPCGLGRIAAKPHTTRRWSVAEDVNHCGVGNGDVLRVVDSTPKIVCYKTVPQPNYCAKIGSVVNGHPESGNGECPARLDPAPGDTGGVAERVACELWALRAKGSSVPGRYAWKSSGCVLPVPDNIAQAACLPLGCWLQVCNADGSVCSERVTP